MIYLHNYASLDDVIGTSAVTPFVGVAENGKAIYASKSKFGDTVKLVADEPNSYFNPYVEEVISGPTNSEIWYTATTKLTETTDMSSKSGGLHTGCFNTTILSHTFDETTGEGIITFNGDVTSVNNYAFMNCSSLTSIILPNSVTSIGINALWNCSVLKSVTCKSTTPPTLHESALYSDSELTAIYVLSESVDAYKAAVNWRTYASIIQAIQE